MATLGEHKRENIGLQANCRGQFCGHGKALDLDLLIERFGEDYEMVGETRIASALKCERCGHRGAVVHIASHGNAYAKAKGG